MSVILRPRPPGRELFFAPLEVALRPEELEMIQTAYRVSKYAHAKQRRDDGGRYFDHPKGSAWIYIDELGGRDAHVITTILLHDVSEDSFLLSPYRIALNFGTEVALDVRAVTKLARGHENTPEYLDRVISRGPRAIICKLCDRLHNQRDLAGCSQEKCGRQIRETREHHLPRLIPALSAHGGPWVDHAQLLEDKILRALAGHTEST